jgi:hypothetical protein
VIFIPWHFPLHNDPSIQGVSKKAENEFVRQYPSIYNHLLQFKASLSKRNKAETGIRYEWYALQRCAATYYPEFEKEKLVYREISENMDATIVNKGLFLTNKIYLVTGSNLRLLLGILNSFLFKRIFLVNANLTGGKGTDYLSKTKIPSITPSNQPIALQIETLVDRILAEKKGNLQADTQELEREIDQLVYQLYGLTQEEIKIVEKAENKR